MGLTVMDVRQSAQEEEGEGEVKIAAVLLGTGKEEVRERGRREGPGEERPALPRSVMVVDESAIMTVEGPAWEGEGGETGEAGAAEKEGGCGRGG